MFTIPSLWNIIISTIIFVVAAWYFHRTFDAHGMPKGMTRSLLVFVLAYVISWASGELVDWSREKLYGPEPASEAQKTLNDALDVLKANGVTTP
jgi:predicted PurR-regulated permease PerM